MFSSSLRLGLVTLIGTALLVGVYLLTRDRIYEQERLAVLQSLNQVLPATLYDNALHDDLIEISLPGFFQHPDPVKVYRARKQSQPVALIMQVIAPNGYNGDIEILVGIHYDGTISGVRITRHKETPGLGDAIEVEKSDWVYGFDGRSLDNPRGAGWGVKRDGGAFDQFTGATITPRAVVQAVQRSLDYYSNHRDELFELPSMSPETTSDQQTAKP